MTEVDAIAPMRRRPWSGRCSAGASTRTRSRARSPPPARRGPDPMNATQWATFWVFLGFLVVHRHPHLHEGAGQADRGLDSRTAKIRIGAGRRPAAARGGGDPACGISAAAQRGGSRGGSDRGAGAAARPRRRAKRRAPESRIMSPVAPRPSSSGSRRRRRRPSPRCGAARSTSRRLPRPASLPNARKGRRATSSSIVPSRLCAPT